MSGEKHITLPEAERMLQNQATRFDNNAINKEIKKIHTTFL